MTVLLPEFPSASQNALLNHEQEKNIWKDPSIQTLRQQLPSYLFQRLTLKSCYYLLHDLFLASLLFYLALCIDPLVTYYDLPFIFHFGLWVTYWIAQGIICTGLWVLAHECGHQSFSSSKRLNHSIGFVLHSVLLVPYHAWRITHGLHHKNTNHLTKDQVFVPLVSSTSNLESPLRDFFGILRMLVAGWPAYLLWNVSGQTSKTWQSHFFPSSNFFLPRHYPLLLLSNMGVIAVLAVLVSVAFSFGFLTLFKYYLVPYFHVNLWLVVITYLQHTDASVPYFDSQSFSFLRGAMATVDRDYGVLNYFFHQIGNTHRVHHLFSTMPHYHAKIASQILRFPLDTTPIPLALWKTYRRCHTVSERKHHLYWYNTASSE